MSDSCANGTAHTGINSICSTCDKPACQSRAPDTGVGCTQDLFHEGQHFNYFFLKDTQFKKAVAPWDDPDYIPKELTEEEIAEAKKWQEDMDQLTRAMSEEYERDEYRKHYG